MRSFQLLALALLAPSVCQAMANPTKTLIVSLSSQVRKGPFLMSPQTSFLSLPRGGGGNLALSPETVQMAETLAPKIGILTSTALYFAPAAAVLSAIQSDDIGDLNPLPLAIMSIVSVAWLAYGLSARDPYVALSNIGGTVASIGYVVGILPLLHAKKSQLRLTQMVVMAGTAATLGLWTVLGLTAASGSKISDSLGLFASGLFVLLSGSPLSTIRSVISTKNSGSILGTLTVAQCVNTALWSTYGLAVKDRFVWGPNVVVRSF